LAGRWHVFFFPDVPLASLHKGRRSLVLLIDTRLAFARV
jgi:hypothetical protein